MQSLLALWLLERFGLSLATTGAIFFWSGLLSAASYLAAVPLARRIGLVNTMVFTHLPANVCLVLVPFAPSLASPSRCCWCAARCRRWTCRRAPPTSWRWSTPGERPAAASVTAVPRSLAAAASPLLAGWLLAASGFGWPLVAGGGLKIVYDLALLAMFRKVRPPEER